MNLAVASQMQLLPARAGHAVEVVADEAALLRLRPAWDRLLEEAGIDHPFLTHEWIRTWWECFGAGKELRVLAVRDGSRLVGLLPLMLSREFMYGVPVRRLGSLYNPHTPRSGWIVAPGVEGVAPAIWRHLLDTRRDWDVLEFCQLAAGCAMPGALRGLADAGGFLTGSWNARPSPYIEVRGHWEPYYSSLRPKLRSNLRNRAKRLGQLGEVALEVVSTADAGALEEGFRIEAAAWKNQAGTAIASHPELRRFYALLAERMAARGWLRLQFLSVGGRRIAFAYSLEYRNRLYLLKPGYDPAYSQYAPGSLLLERVLHDAFERGVDEHDFLGVDDAWKHEWTPLARAHDWLHVFPATPRGALLHTTKFRIIPMLRSRSD